MFMEMEYNQAIHRMTDVWLDSPLLAECKLILCCLPSSEAFVSMAEKTLFSCMTAGRVLVETGTTEIGEINDSTVRCLKDFRTSVTFDLKRVNA